MCAHVSVYVLMCQCTCVHMCQCVCSCTSVCAHVPVCVCSCASVCAHVPVCVCSCACVCAHVPVCVCAHMPVCVCSYACIFWCGSIGSVCPLNSNILPSPHGPKHGPQVVSPPDHFLYVHFSPNKWYKSCMMMSLGATAHTSAMS